MGLAQTLKTLSSPVVLAGEAGMLGKCTVAAGMPCQGLELSLPKGRKCKRQSYKEWGLCLVFGLAVKLR